MGMDHLAAVSYPHGQVRVVVVRVYRAPQPLLLPKHVLLAVPHLSVFYSVTYLCVVVAVLAARGRVPAGVFVRAKELLLHDG